MPDTPEIVSAGPRRIVPTGDFVPRGLAAIARAPVPHMQKTMEARRRDYLMSLICQVSALPVAWHPVVYGLHQRIRRTREMVCDAMAAREMRSETTYARCLITLSPACEVL